MSVQEIRDWYRVRPGYWFRPKLFGLGATPVTWQGWAMVLGFVAIALAVALFAAQHRPIYAIVLAPLTLGFTWLCWLKTDGAWRWRWGLDGD